MFWMITDFSKSKNLDNAYSDIAVILDEGVSKVTLRNQNFFKDGDIVRLYFKLKRNFPEAEIFFHGSLPENTEAGFNLHLKSDSIEEVSGIKKRFPETKTAVSTHSKKEFERAFELGADYAFYSPVFPPVSKPEDKRKTVSPINRKNLYLLGGIDKIRAEKLIRDGYINLAGISLFYGEYAAVNIRNLINIQKRK